MKGWAPWEGPAGRVGAKRVDYGGGEGRGVPEGQGHVSLRACVHRLTGAERDGVLRRASVCGGFSLGFESIHSWFVWFRGSGVEMFGD